MAQTRLAASYFAVVFLQLAALPAFAAPSLQLIPGGWSAYAGYRALNLSGDGSTVVGYGMDGSNMSSVFLWSQAGGVIKLNTAPFATSGADVFTAPGVSAAGSAVAFAAAGQLFRWTASGGASYLAGPADLPGGETVVNANLSADGSIVYANTSGGSLLKWTATEGIVNLGKPVSALPVQRVLDVSADGQKVVGRLKVSDTREIPFLWTATGGYQELPFPTAASSTGGANAISADGALVVGTSRELSGGDYAAVQWAAESWLPLTDAGIANWTDVSADMSVLIGNTFYEAYIGDETHGVRTLKSALTAMGLDIPLWELFNAQAISDDGMTIVGHTGGRSQTGIYIAIIPEPATLGLLLAALPLLSRRRQNSPRQRIHR